ncbi:hypothetical protein [uncultured Thiodictyon sp.]|uniref:hypothetical protein n=1 Tax=uncultured Thiodictyon sp. TaxID=1846217 RepID=UPI0025E54115|nr:hypothetical protein [uncultured Thiodictyon sp.]
MSGTADILRDLESLIGALDALLRTSTAREAPNIARELGVEAQLNSGVDAVGGALDGMDGGLAALGRQLVQVDAVLAGFETFADGARPVADGRVFNAVTDYLEIPGRPLDPLARGLALGQRYLDAGLKLADLVPEPGAIAANRLALGRLAESLKELKAAA